MILVAGSTTDHYVYNDKALEAVRGVIKGG